MFSRFFIQFIEFEERCVIDLYNCIHVQARRSANDNDDGDDDDDDDDNSDEEEKEEEVPLPEQEDAPDIERDITVPSQNVESSALMENQASDSQPSVMPTPLANRGSKDFLVHNSNKYATGRSMANFVFCFPFLFPFGRGGYDESRPVHMSEQAWFMRCLRVHGGAFQTHHGFIAMGYDSIATALAFNAQYISMRFTKRSIEQGMISKETVKMCLKYQEDIKKSKTRGMKVIFLQYVDDCVYFRYN